LIKYPTQDAIEGLLESRLAETGTQLVFLNRSNFSFILESVKEIGKNSDSAALIAKASYLIAKTINLHPLVDGNKRAAAILTLFFLATNSKKLVASQDEFYDILLGFARHELNENDISNWLASNVR